MDDGEVTTQSFTLQAHEGTNLHVVYTNDPRAVDTVLAMYEAWLKEEPYRIVGLDLEYTNDKKRIAVIQLAMRQHVLVFHYRRSDKCIPNLRKFLEKKDITFGSVDTTNDKTVLEAEWISIPGKYHVDIQTLYRIPGKGLKAGMGDLAAELVHSSYKNMKHNFKTISSKHQGHDFWEWKPLAKVNLDYAAVDGYLSYELLRKLYELFDRTSHLMTFKTLEPPQARKKNPRKSKPQKGKDGWDDWEM